MTATIRCPNPDCPTSFSVGAEQLGKKAKCPKCGTRFEVAMETMPTDKAPSIAPAALADAGELAGRLGRYRVVRKLGQGGMGSVYLAHDEELDRPVALKVPASELVADPAFAERFRREARAAASFHHPNFCPVHDVGQVDGVTFMAMAFVEGRPLSDRLKNGPPPPREAAEIVATLAEALEEAHRRGIVHRDLKPANVMVDSRGTLIVMDFGLARRASEGESELTRTGAVMGTPYYMAPEQARGDKNAIGPGVDIYALGVILFELLTGRRPFEGAPSQVFVRAAADPPPMPSQLRKGIDPVLEAICLNALAKDPKHRQESCAQLARELRGWLETKSGAATVAMPTFTAPAPTRRRWLLVGVAAILAGGGGVGLAFWLRGRGPGGGGGAVEVAGKSEARPAGVAAAPTPRWALEFDGQGFARTDVRYDGMRPITIEALIMNQGRGPQSVINQNRRRRPRENDRGLGLVLNPGGHWVLFLHRTGQAEMLAAPEPTPPDAFARVLAMHNPVMRRSLLLVAGMPPAYSHEEEAPMPGRGPGAPFLLGGAYDPEGPGASAHFRGRIAWVRFSDVPRIPRDAAHTHDPPPADEHTTLLLDFTRGPDDPAIRRAIAEGHLVLEGARFVREAP